jgi:TatD family-associated radical SAM protein
VGDAESLWLTREPGVAEIRAAFDSRDLSGIAEVIFCGYGEPMERADTVMQTCEYIKSKCLLPIRLNTNGLVKLLFPCFDLSRLSIFDSVSISLNAADEAEYLRVTRPRFGAPSYAVMCEFAQEVMKYTAVSFTVVDVIGKEQIEKCREIARSMGVPLRVRNYIGNLTKNYVEGEHYEG